MWSVLLGALALLPVNPAQALTIYVDEANPPFMYRDHDRAAGIYPEIVRAISAHAGITVEIVPVPWRRALLHLENGDGAVAGIYKNLERQKKYAFSDPVHRESLMIYRPAGKFSPETRIEDLSGMNVGVIRGWSYGNAFDSARASGMFDTSEAAGDDQNFAMLVSKRIDAVIAVREAGDIWIRKLELEDKVVRGQNAIYENQTFIAFNRKSQDISQLARINRAIAELIANGTMEAVIANAVNQAIGSGFH
ncbi:amino acid ABC transporter substrate-binding protein [Thalassospira sp. HF15]|uniref:substrate-binding periplasmic protein n=1 Tax=Thalassospira sp. HF15 TaxID=2722755 RepID=UPI001431D6C4|nr:transporter substrate-binding domain-containing protein [Thalassospira sp. HF15]NIY77489.1 amino acid ABC transporter substrate-binding protein [Thalassospira sp. HF15]